MEERGLQEFRQLIEGCTDDEIAHILAVLTAATQHMDQQQKERQMAKKPIDFDEFNDRRKAIDPEVQRLAEYARPVSGRDRSLDDDIERMERMQQAQGGGR